MVCFFRHGDMVYLVDVAPTECDDDEMGDDCGSGLQPGTSQNGPTLSNHVPDNAMEHAIDIFLSKQDGLIHREKDPQL